MLDFARVCVYNIILRVRAYIRIKRTRVGGLFARVIKRVEKARGVRVKAPKIALKKILKIFQKSAFKQLTQG